MHELMAVVRIIFLSLLMVAILVVMTLSLLSILNDDMVIEEGTIELKKGRFFNIFLKLGLCGITMVVYFVMMIIIR